MEDEHPYIIAFFVSIIAAAVFWVAFSVVEVVLVDYILMPGCNGTLWLANKTGLTSWSSCSDLVMVLGRKWLPRWVQRVGDYVRLSLVT